MQTPVHSTLHVPGANSVATTLLRNVPLLSALGESELAIISRSARLKSCARGTTVCAAGITSGSIYVLVRGRAKVFIQDGAGREMILRILGPGEFFGETGLIDSSARTSVVMLEACELISIAKSDFTQCLAANFDMTRYVIRELVTRLRDAEIQIGTLALTGVLGRVLQLLRQAAEVVDGRKVVRKKLSHQDIASRVGASREMVTRTLKRLRLQGLVEIHGRSIIVRDDLLSSR
jgi:CRP/FNR family cyclic AMP-dependent transcriptional regulator